MIYPNNTGYSRVPLGVVYLLTILKEQGHDIKMFDMTFYGVNLQYHLGDARSKVLNFRPVDLAPYGVTHKKSTLDEVKQDLLAEIEQFMPDLIGITIAEETSLLGFEFANLIKERYPGILIVFGGVFCMAAPEIVALQPSADIICIGEGEVALSELIHCLESGKDFTNVPGLWVKKKDNTFAKNDVAPPVELEELPFPDLGLIDDRHLFAPMAGHVYKQTYLVSKRTCPRRCNYCANQIFLNTYKKYLKQYLHRRMSIPRLIDNLVYLKDNFKINFFQLYDEDFLVRSLEEITYFSNLYKEKVRLPFWIQVEANHVTEEKISLLKDAGCIAMAIGIETGSNFIRKQIYNRHTSKEASLRAFKIMHKYNIRISGNVIIGAPSEGRKEIFETIELVRKCKPSAFNVNFLMPFYGTVIRNLCIEKGYIDHNFMVNGRVALEPILNMPQISKSELEGLRRTFALYVTLPKKYWPMIQKCESKTEEGEKIFDELSELYWEIAAKRGMDYDVPGFDYDAFLEDRRIEMEIRSGFPKMTDPNLYSIISPSSPKSLR